MNGLRKGSKDLIKEINRSIVINLIRDSGKISRSDISKITEMSLSTVTYIVDELLGINLVREVGVATSTGGRRPVLLEFNADYGYTVGLKIEEKRILFALTNLNADILELVEKKFDKSDDIQNIVSLIAHEITEILQKSNIEQEQLMGIGIAASGLINRQEGTIVRSSMLGWENIPICQWISERVNNIPVFIDKNVNAYAMAELWSGEGKDLANFVCISVGAGLGMALVVDKKIYYGEFGGAGEFGHTVLKIGGFPCHCGQRGCLEMYASEFFLSNQGEELREKYPDTMINDFTFEDVHAAAVKGDRLALELMDSFGENLGYGILNAINSLNPHKILLIGEGMKYKESFIEAAINIAKVNFFSAANIQTEIIPTQLGDDSWLKGASLLAINHLFQAPIYEESKSLLN
ncbi:XylR family transcriptional regulator [Bacillus sp. V3-13]|uniref:ROK family protein n=1 Tax=Bacillus sp. V3-13 TaxID=2053728 RepID=UPI000C75FE85|nr:ROK family protein [Bacillus sp. V3-13]PLR77372.1 XylR family transcriptional regulator [Bacillus sp. V3-13]